MASKTSLAIHSMALSALALLLICGCQTSAPADAAAERPLRMERISGADGKHIGWIRTDQATADGGTYEVIYDADWNEIGSTANPGNHYRPDGSRLESLGYYDRERGIARLTGERAVDVNMTEVSSKELARSGPYSTPGAAKTITNRPDGDVEEGDKSDADGDEVESEDENEDE